jgi:ferredoxin-NADP reductase
VTRETDSVGTIGLKVPDWPGHQAGQHLDVRLTAEDGYTAERSYSIATADGEPVAITVERLDDGEVSPYLTEELRAGDQLELRGPIGRWFVWDTSDGGPSLLVAGGCGIVPLRAIRGPLPRLLQRAHGHLSDPGHELRRPQRPDHAGRSGPDLVVRLDDVPQPGSVNAHPMSVGRA